LLRESTSIYCVSSGADNILLCLSLEGNI
jgi:hypothetical protein